METKTFFDVEMEVVAEEKLNLEPKLSPERPERPSSPADCAICLEQLKDKSFTDSCLHMFCFHCLKAWSEVKPECPLCKQDFSSIIHNIRSMTDYDEYHVPPVEPPRFTYTPPHLSASEIADSYAAHELLSNRRRLFSYRPIMPNTYTIPRLRSTNLVIQPYIDNLQLEANFSHSNSMQSTVARCHRAEVYLRQLETRPPNTGRYRECSPDFYRSNETQIHRLSRWLHRELLALSQIGVRFNVHEVKQVILNMLLLYSINSSIFHDILSQHLGGHTSRFIREFYSFATSPYEMDQYDRECVLVRPRNGSHLSFIVTVGRDESEDVQVIPSPPLEEPVRPWIGVNRTIPSSLSSTSSGFRLISRLASHSPFRCGHVATSSTNTNPTTSVINLTDSETEDCVILDDAPGPETIVLDDSDNEVETPAVTLASPILSYYPYSCGNRPLDLSTSRSTSSQTSDPTPVALPPPLPGSSSHSFQEPRETSVPIEDEVNLPSRLYPLKRHRSRSIDSSVLSTCISSDESDHRYRKKRSKRLCRTKSKRSAVHQRYSSDEFLKESSSEDAASDSDWAADSRRKHKKKSKKSHTSKREKKVSSKRRKKPTERKSRKKKPSNGDDSADDADRKSRQRKEKTKSKRRTRTSVEVVESPRSAGGSKLCSVVKVVHRDSDSFLLDQPSTSSGYRGYDSRNDFIKVSRRNHVVTDSD